MHFQLQLWSTFFGGKVKVRTRIVAEVTLDVPGLDEPAIGRLVSIPERRAPMLNDLQLVRGNYVAPGSTDQVLISEAFATANRLEVGDRIGAVLNGRWKELAIAGIALSPGVDHRRAERVVGESAQPGVLRRVVEQHPLLDHRLHRRIGESANRR